MLALTGGASSAAIYLKRQKKPKLAIIMHFNIITQNIYLSSLLDNFLEKIFNFLIFDNFFLDFHGISGSFRPRSALAAGRLFPPSERKKFIKNLQLAARENFSA